MKTAKHKNIRCHRCYRRKRRTVEPGRGEWNEVYSLGTLTAYLCPDCQTPEENAEALIKDATGEAPAVEWIFDEHSGEENAEVIVTALVQHADNFWRAWLRSVAAGVEPGTLDLDALATRAWDSLSPQWRERARDAEAVQTGTEIIRDHLGDLYLDSKK